MRSGYKASNHRHKDADVRVELYRLDLRLEAESIDEAKNLAAAWQTLQEVMFGVRRGTDTHVSLTGIELLTAESRSR